MVLYLDGPVDVRQDTTVVGEGNMSPSEDTSRHITIHVDYTYRRTQKTFLDLLHPRWIFRRSSTGVSSVSIRLTLEHWLRVLV